MIEKIARKIIADDGNNVFDDYYDFYQDSKWIIQVVRDLNNVLSKLSVNITQYNNFYPKAQELLGYLQQTKLSQMKVGEAVNSLKTFLNDLRKNYNDYNDADEDNKIQFHKQYNDLLNEEKTFMKSFQQSCVNIFRNRFVEDEENVRNLLEEIRNSGNQVLNKR